MINGSQWNKRIKESIPESGREDYMGNISLGIWFIRRLPDEREDREVSFSGTLKEAALAIQSKLMRFGTNFRPSHRRTMPSGATGKMFSRLVAETQVYGRVNVPRM